MRAWFLLVTLAVLASCGPTPRSGSPGPAHLERPLPRMDQPDRLAEALDAVGFTRADLGCSPRGYWSRFPNIDHVPHLLPFFPDLFAEPLHTYDFARVMAGALEEHLSPAYRIRYGNAMFKVVHFLGIEKKVVGPRGYDYRADFSVFAGDEGDSQETANPVVEAVEALWAASGSAMEPGGRAQLAADAAAIPPCLLRPFARLVREVAGAHHWRQVAFARSRSGDLATLAQWNGAMDKEYEPAADRVAAELDAQSLYHAAQLCVRAVEVASRDLEAALDSSGAHPSGLSFRAATPLGDVVLTGTAPNRHENGPWAVLVDLGGSDQYIGPVGASTPQAPLSVALDLSGDDEYDAADNVRAAQGAGILGAGILLDRQGDDSYTAHQRAQGLGLFGLGLLWDDAGTDAYSLGYSGQGCGYFGVGLLVDGDGDDRYYLWADGQGFGGVGGGVGVLADRAGADRYVAEPDAHITRRGSGHSHKRVTSSNAQGAASGRRGDLSDGHIWAGGLGALVDLEGDDQYEAGNWAIGAGYWFGTGLLYDGGGNDTYRSVYYSLASGAHFCIGAVLDESGDDTYTVWDPPIADDLVAQGRGMNAAGGAGLSFAWDFCVSLLVDKAGNDQYEGRIISGARAMIRSTAILADLGDGDDRYVLPANAGAGSAAHSYIGVPDTVLPSFLIEYTPASNYGTNFALLLDTGGTDQYLEWRDSGDHVLSPRWRDGHTWLQPAPDSAEYGNESFGLGMDVEGGTVPEFHRFQRQLLRR